jgi:hypothetical protein
MLVLCVILIGSGVAYTHTLIYTQQLNLEDETQSSSTNLFEKSQRNPETNEEGKKRKKISTIHVPFISTTHSCMILKSVSNPIY